VKVERVRLPATPVEACAGENFGGCEMGSNKSRARTKHGKQVHAQHLPKVGTKPARHQHEERDAVLDNMGLGGASHATRVVLGIIAAVVVIGGIFALLALTTFR
jgi:hypothetical protein